MHLRNPLTAFMSSFIISKLSFCILAIQQRTIRARPQPLILRKRDDPSPVRPRSKRPRAGTHRGLRPRSRTTSTISGNRSSSRRRSQPASRVRNPSFVRRIRSTGRCLSTRERRFPSLRASGTEVRRSFIDRGDVIPDDVNGSVLRPTF